MIWISIGLAYVLLTAMSSAAKVRAQNAEAHAHDTVMPHVRLLWQTLNYEASAHLTVDEMHVLGHAMVGHPPTTEEVCLQIHRMRAALMAREAVDMMCDKFSSMRDATKIRGSNGRKASSRQIAAKQREQESTVRDFVSSRLRELLKRHLLSMFPSQGLEYMAEKLRLDLEQFFADLPFGRAGMDAGANVTTGITIAKPLRHTEAQKKRAASRAGVGKRERDSSDENEGTDADENGSEDSDTGEGLLGDLHLSYAAAAKIGSVLQKQFRRSRSREAVNARGTNPNRMGLEMHVLSVYLLSPSVLKTVTQMEAPLFWVTESQFQAFAVQELIGAKDYSTLLRGKVAFLVDFLNVIMHRVYLLQGRLNQIQQRSLHSILTKQLRDMNYHFVVDVRAKQAANPHRQQFVVREAVQTRTHPHEVEWREVDGKWVCLSKSPGAEL